jgi:hypothetical protein
MEDVWMMYREPLKEKDREEETGTGWKERR